MKKSFRVGLIDDNEVTRAGLRLLLNAENFVVVMEAGTARAGVELAVRIKPDIVCLDVMLPDGNGIEVLRTLKDALPNSRFVMVTAVHDAETIREAIAAGAHGFVIKPFRGKLAPFHKKIISASVFKSL